MYTPDRTMTVKRCLTRLKTLKRQLDSNISDISMYGAWSNQSKHPLGIDNNDTTTTSVKQTIDRARTKVQSIFQSTESLLQEYNVLLVALARTNLHKTIKVADENMTIYEALMYKKYLLAYYDRLIDANDKAVSRAQKSVDRFNESSSIEVDGKKIKADLVHFLSADKMQGYKDFNTKFLEELNGAIDDSNIRTTLMFDDVPTKDSEVVDN